MPFFSLVFCLRTAIKQIFYEWIWKIQIAFGYSWGEKKNRILWKEIKSSAPTKDPNDCNFTLSPLQQEWQQQAGGSDENQRKKTEPKQKLLQKQQLRVRISEQLLSNHWATVGNAHAIIMNMPIAEKRYCRKNHTRWMYVMYLCTITPYLCLNRVLRHLILSFLFYGIRSLC